MNPEDLDLKHLEIEAEVGLHERCMKGRDGYQSGIRPNHWILGRDYCFIGQVTFQSSEWLRPGQIDKANIQCLIASQDRELFQPDFCWHIAEGGQIVGHGKVIKVLS